MKKTISGKKLTFLLTLIYFTSYVTRINFAAIIQEVVTDTGFEKSTLSIILVCLSITYGVGQIINGRIGDKIKAENLILMGLLCSSAMNLLFPFFASSLTMMCVLWGINGFAQAMLWPPIVKIMVGCMDEAMYSYATVRISWGSSFGTVAVYLTAPLIISLVGWRAVFIFASAIGILMSAIWFLLKGRLDEYETAVSTSSSKEKFNFPKAAVFPIIFIAFGIIFQGMLRDGVTTWMPSYLADVAGFNNEKSILITVILAIFSIFTFYIVGKIYKRFFKNEVSCAVSVWGAALISAALMFFLYDNKIAAILFMALIVGAMHGINLMLIQHVPKRFRKYGNISTISGAINSCTYIGSAIFTYVIAVLSEKIGWQYTVGIWAIISALGLLCCLIAAKSWRKFSEQ